MTQRSKYINPQPPPSQQPIEQSSSIINKLKLQSHNQKYPSIDISNNDKRLNNKIIIRKNRNKFITEQPPAEKSMRKTMNYLSNRFPAQLISSSNNLEMTFRPKEQFIDILQSKVINSNGDYKGLTCKDQIKFNSTRYNNHLDSHSFRINIKSHHEQKSKEGNCLSAEPREHITHRTQHYIPSFRTRSRTMAKEQLSSNTKIGETHKELSKTIEVDQLGQKQKMHKSLVQIQKYEKISIGRETKEALPSNYQFIHQEVALPILTSKPQEAILELDSTVHIHNTETYEKEVNSLTKDYFQEWEKMNFTKSKLYKSLRKKLVSVFPNLKKHYKQFRQSSLPKNLSGIVEEEFNRKTMQDLISFTLKSQNNLITSNLSTSNNINQVKDYEQKIRQFNQNQLLRDIFKQAYFWSRTKNKFMANNFQQEQQAQIEQRRNLKKIQTKLTFINYMKSKNSKSQILNNPTKIKGSNIMRNKEVILQMEKEGSKQQQFLKKCLENAIQNCIRISK